MKKRLYEITVEIPSKKGKVIRKIKFKGIDSVHASIDLTRFFGRTKVKILSAVPIKEE